MVDKKTIYSSASICQNQTDTHQRTDKANHLQSQKHTQASLSVHNLTVWTLSNKLIQTILKRG